MWLETSHTNSICGSRMATQMGSLRKFNFLWCPRIIILHKSHQLMKDKSHISPFYPPKFSQPLSFAPSSFSSPTSSYSPKLLYLASSCPNLPHFPLCIIKQALRQAQKPSSLDHIISATQVVRRYLQLSQGFSEVGTSKLQVEELKP